MHSNEKKRSWRAAVFCESFAHRVFPTSSSVPTAASAVGVLTRARAPRTRSSPQRRVARIAERRRRRAEPRESGDPRARGPGAVCRPQTVMGTAEDSPSRAMPRGFRADVPERVIPASRRPDGSMRKEIRVRAGYVNQDEVRRYTPGAFRRAREEEASRRQTPASAPINRGTPTPKRERKRGRGRQPPATRREVPRALTRSPPCPLVNRGRARRRARRRRRRNREPPRGPPPPTTTTTTTKTRSPRPHAPGTLKDSIGVVRVPRVCRRLGRGKRARRRRRRRRCAKASGTCAFARREAETVVEGAEAEEEGRDGDEAIITD